jgi:PGF-pre-PGF domain-containing protein
MREQVSCADFTCNRLRRKFITSGIATILLLGSFSLIFGNGVLGDEPGSGPLPLNSMKIENTDGIAGQIYSIEVYGKWNITMAGYQITFYYDASKIEIYSISKVGTVIDDYNLDSIWRLYWDNDISTGCVTAGAYRYGNNTNTSHDIPPDEGSLFNLAVFIKDNATNGETILDLTGWADGGSPGEKTIYSDSNGIAYDPDYLYDGILTITGGNEPPYTPYDPAPCHLCEGVDIDANLTWTGGDQDDDSVTYDVYFGGRNPPPQVAWNQTETTYDPPGMMSLGTRYYWQIKAWDNHGASATGMIWTFTTESVPSTDETLFVDDDFNSNTPDWNVTNFSSIQDALDVVAEYGIVYVYSGEYYENIMVTKAVNLIGEDKSTTVIDGGGSGSVVKITADSVTISGFTIQNSGDGSDNAGIYVLHAHYSTISNNDISSNLYGIYLNSGGNNTITGNNILNNSITGIYVFKSCNNYIANNIANNNSYYGIDVYFDSTNNSVINNTANNNKHHGIQVAGSCNNDLIDNTANNNYQCGFNVDQSHYNTITKNNIGNNNHSGITIALSSNNTITGNTIHNNSFRGIWLVLSSNNTITENTITNNNQGTYLSQDTNNDNTVYHNYFIDNTGHASDGGVNSWDNGYPSGGNFWDDYTGTDADGDGIGDTPYDIPGGNNQDNYPLMNPCETGYDTPFDPDSDDQNESEEQEEIIAEENIIVNASSGEHIEITLEPPEDAYIYNINLTLKKDVSNIGFSETKLITTPEGIPLISNAVVYVYLNLKLTGDGIYLAENDIESLKFKYKVEKTWLTAHNINKETVQLVRYHNGTWHNLTTQRIDEDDIYVYYESDSPGCSTFAIVGSQITERSEPYSPGIVIPWNIIIVAITAIIALLVVVLFKAGYIYKVEDPQRKKPQKE